MAGAELNTIHEYELPVAGLRLRLRCLALGRDFCLVLGGGQEHIGAVALAQPRPSLEKPERVSATASVLALPGHQEDLLARELALKAASALDAPVCVLCGIHLDRAAPDTINSLVQAAHQLVEDFLASRAF